MTAADLKSALRQLGWSQSELARRLGLHVNTVSAWMTGKAVVPEYAAAHVGLAVQVKALAQTLEPEKRR